MFTAACGYATRSELGSHKGCYVEHDLREPSTWTARGYAIDKDKAFFQVMTGLRPSSVQDLVPADGFACSGTEDTCREEMRGCQLSMAAIPG